MSLQNSNLTSGFIDLATYDELEKYMYGGADATAYFVRETRKSTWFTQVPVVLSRASGQPAFNQNWSVSISRAGDYLLNTWLRVNLPAVTSTGLSATNQSISYTPNLMHNLVQECSITFNDLVAARFDTPHLDFWSAFTTPAGKQNGYDNMIGNTANLVNAAQNLPATTLNLPLPFFYARDSGVALPTAALPYNEMRINFQFRDYTELITLWTTDGTAGNVITACVAVSASNLTAVPALADVQVWATYAIVSNDERKRMACAPRDILIEQVQTAPIQTFSSTVNQAPQQFDIRFSHAIKVLFFAVRNISCPSYRSNYLAGSPSSMANANNGALTIANNLDPIQSTSLIYENTQRLSNMGSDYYSLVDAWYTAPVIPQDTGYHMYSYSLDFICLDPLGSTNYGKLTNVSIAPSASTAIVTTQTYEFIVTAVNNNIIRISGGALGFPVL